MSTRKDYGPQGGAERSAALIGALGFGAFMFGLMGKLSFHVTTRVLIWLENRRDSASA